MAPLEAKNLSNPLPRTDAVLAEGRALFAQRCAACHRGTGQGGQVVADLTSERVQSESDGELFWKITEGNSLMPGWPHLTERERWALVHAIRAIPK